MSTQHLPITIDCNYIRPQFAAAFLIKEENEGIFIENNTTHSVPFLLEGLNRVGLKTHEVKYIIVTHVHLDHAGGTSALMKKCPNATLIAHPKAAKHLIDPTKLIASATDVYGKSTFEKLYGELTPIDANRVHAVEDGEEISIGTRKLSFFYTRGHANHHICIFDNCSNGVFTGDSFGLAYPSLQSKGLFIFASTSPTDFDPVEARLSIQKILNTGASRVFLTHFGELKMLSQASFQLNQYLDFSENLMNEMDKNLDTTEAKKLQSYCEDRIRDYLMNQLRQLSVEVSPEMAEILKLDIELNAAGIIYAIQRKRAKK